MNKLERKMTVLAKIDYFMDDYRTEISGFLAHYARAAVRVKMKGGDSIKGKKLFVSNCKTLSEIETSEKSAFVHSSDFSDDYEILLPPGSILGGHWLVFWVSGTKDGEQWISPKTIVGFVPADK